MPDPSGLLRRMKIYQATAIFSVLFALVGFSYNVWRMEASEHNDTVRNASFEILLQLAELEQLVYAAYYDQDASAGSPRVGWVKVGLIADLGYNSAAPVQHSAGQLKEIWSTHWQTLPAERASADAIVVAIDSTRLAVQHALRQLD